MVCPSCQAPTRVIETRAADGGGVVRRRRECRDCGARMTTFERHEPDRLWVRKRDGRREPFDRTKLLNGLLRAAYKRPVRRADAAALVDRIAADLARAGGELEAERVGDMALAGLAELDRIAYLQFAAVYRGFDDVSEFTSELRRLGFEPADPAEDDPGPPIAAASADPDPGGSVRAGGDSSSFPPEAATRRRFDG